MLRGHPLPGPRTPQAAECPVPPGAAPPAPHWHSLACGHDRGQGARRPHLPGPLPHWALGVLATQRPPPTRLARVAPMATGRRPSGSHRVVGLRRFSDWHPSIWACRVPL